jgi:hypothetical protein
MSLHSPGDGGRQGRLRKHHHRTFTGIIGI